MRCARSIYLHNSRLTLQVSSALGLGLALVLFLILASHAGAGVGVTSRVSTASDGLEASGGSAHSSISADGRYVVFRSQASNLLGPGGDTNSSMDIFRKDTHTGEIVRVSTTSSGVQANGGSYSPSVSADGRYVAFTSDATNLLGPVGDTNSRTDIFRKDMQTGSITRVSTRHMSDNQLDAVSQEPAISADGRYIAFRTNADNVHCSPSDIGCLPEPDGDFDVFVKDTQTKAISIASTAANGFWGDWDSYSPAISADGRYVAFLSGATNLLGPGGDTNSMYDIYRKDMQTGSITRVSTRHMSDNQLDAISYSPAISADGRYVAFYCLADNVHCSPSDIGCLKEPDSDYDVFVKDTQTKAIFVASTDANGFWGDNSSSMPSISGDGRYLAFISSATNLLGPGGDTNLKQDIYVKDIQTGVIIRASNGMNRVGSNNYSEGPTISADGRYVAFESLASNLVPSDNNNMEDVFISPVGRHYLFTWYDDIGGDNWVLMANPESASKDAWFNIAIAGNALGTGALAGLDPGQVPAGQALTPMFPGVMGGPVDVGSLTGEPAIISQRSLWPKGGSSIEEVMGNASERLSNHYYWSWYDQMSPGYSNWVLVNNPGADRVYYEIKIAGTIRDSGLIDPGNSLTPTFPGIIGGPVEVEAWRDSSKTVPAPVMASQRVLSGGGAAFNEVPGMRAEDLASRYVWPWYDNVGGHNWILVANPYSTARTYTIKIGGTVMPGYENRPLGPYAIETPIFDGIRDGPVSLEASGIVIASQRIVFGPSFGETMGTPETFASLVHMNHYWTWYDMVTPGMQNWILVANPDDGLLGPIDVTYTIRIGGNPVPGYTNRPLPAGAIETPTFPGIMDGPVTVTSSPAPVITSQRVLYNGYFNEVVGATLN